MNGYVESGYVVVFASLGTYGLSLLGRERAARRRLGARPMTRATNTAYGKKATGAATTASSASGASPAAAVRVASGRPGAAGDEPGPGARP